MVNMVQTSRNNRVSNFAHAAQLIVFLFLPLIVAPFPSSAQVDRFQDTACGVTPSRTLFRNQKREEVVLFFQNHLPKKPLNLLEFLASYNTKAARVAELKDALESNLVSQRSLDEIVNTLGDRFVQKKLAWTGVEKEADEIGIVDEEELYKASTAIETQLKKDKVKSGDIKAFLLLQLGPVQYARWKNIGLRKAARLVPLDDAAIRLRVNAYTDKMQEKADVLLKSVAHSGLRTSEMERLVEISQIDLFSGERARSAEYGAIVAKVKKADVRKMIDEYRTWIEQGIESFKERERLIANQILAQPGSGLIQLSRNLGPGISDYLVNSCNARPIKK